LDLARQNKQSFGRNRGNSTGPAGNRRPIKHARYHWRLLPESHLTWRLFGVAVRQIVALPLPAG
jgi:hypothetical protein